MTSFVHLELPTEHPGVARAERAARSIRQASRKFDAARGAAALLLAAIISALLVVANQIANTWSEGRLLAVWIVMWAVGFAALALLAAPARNAGLRIRELMQLWAAQRKQAAADEQLWNAALTDARLMADISRAMCAGADLGTRGRSA